MFKALIKIDETYCSKIKKDKFNFHLHISSQVEILIKKIYIRIKGFT